MDALIERLERCPICDWPMVQSAAQGCVPNNCSYRPDTGTEEWQRIERNRAAWSDCDFCHGWGQEWIGLLKRFVPCRCDTGKIFRKYKEARALQQGGGK